MFQQTELVMQSQMPKEYADFELRQLKPRIAVLTHCSFQDLTMHQDRALKHEAEKTLKKVYWLERGTPVMI